MVNKCKSSIAFQKQINKWLQYTKKDVIIMVVWLVKSAEATIEAQKDNMVI
ncbi:MAG: hypothetical protein IJT36_06905 [Alphaproteobacteria bacterium]|nr:hypothetical protein [Alphaproteobacteria bacterium]